MKNYLNKLVSGLAIIAGLFSTPAFASGNTLQCPQNNTTYVSSGGTSYSSGSTGLVTSVVSGKDVGSLLAAGCTAQGMAGDTIGASGTAGTLTIYPATAAYGTLAVTDSGNSGAFNTIINNASVGQADTLTIPDPGNATASFVLTKGTQTISGATTLSNVPTINKLTLTAPATGSTLTLADGKTVTVNNTLTLAGTDSTTMTFPSSSDTVLGAAAANAITGVNTFGAGSSIVSKTSTSATDINPPYDNRILGNPVVKYVYGSCSVAAVNAGTCVPLALGTGRTIAVLNYDIVAAGSAATCTGILLEDTTGTPVVVSTIAAAALTSGTHNFPGIANNTLGVGFGAGSGLTASQGLQIKVNGSSCTTTTAFQYAITYAVQ